MEEQTTFTPETFAQLGFGQVFGEDAEFPASPQQFVEYGQAQVFSDSENETGNQEVAFEFPVPEFVQGIISDLPELIAQGVEDNIPAQQQPLQAEQEEVVDPVTGSSGNNLINEAIGTQQSLINLGIQQALESNTGSGSSESGDSASSSGFGGFGGFGGFDGFDSFGGGSGGSSGGFGAPVSLQGENVVIEIGGNSQTLFTLGEYGPAIPSGGFSLA
jgi:hypothetical protein